MRSENCSNPAQCQEPSYTLDSATHCATVRGNEASTSLVLAIHKPLSLVLNIYTMYREARNINIIVDIMASKKDKQCGQFIRRSPSMQTSLYDRKPDTEIKKEKKQQKQQTPKLKYTNK
ncbi:Hypothetical predicted protein [Octopus vulgaris]|uniref:Uncharacterized protein n=1 Tax=Octopus vulgaris TaxID=6645 RepID=A0AA36BDA1_OCTVU|nr:Hypothetical predicted protein [Octopus vulgaris]